MTDPHNISSQQNAQGRPPPEVAGIRFGPKVAAVLYLLLTLSAFLALWAWRAPSDLPVPLRHLSPWIFLTFLAAFGAYRLVLVRMGRYPASKALFQIGAGVLFFTFLLPTAQDRFRPVDEGQRPLVRLLADPNPEVRALAAEVARSRPDGAVYARELVNLLTDSSPEVRAQAHDSLVKLAGEDLGPAGSPDAERAWRKRFP